MPFLKLKNIDLEVEREYNELVFVHILFKVSLGSLYVMCYQKCSELKNNLVLMKIKRTYGLQC